MPGRVLRLDDLAFRYLLIGVGLTWSGAFAVIAHFYQFELYGDGAMFSSQLQSGMSGHSTAQRWPAATRKLPTPVVARAATNRLHHNVLATPLANNSARITWIVLAQGRSYAGTV